LTAAAVEEKVTAVEDEPTATMLRKRRPCATPYMPPHVKLRREEDKRWEQIKAEWHRRLAEEDANGKVAANQQPPSGPNMRTLARQWEPWLERPGMCCFNPLQKDVGVDVDEDGICAECIQDLAEKSQRQPCPWGPGVKAIPLVAGGRYHYEVELLRDGAVVVGWSAATSLPSGYDALAFGYGPDGVLVHGNRSCISAGVYGPPFGKKGDVVGAILEWPECRRAGQRKCTGPKISFTLNGQSLGVAFDLAGPGAPGAGAYQIPLQPHLCQAEGGPAFKVLFRGASEAAPLRFPMEGFLPLGESREAHFCPFSSAVAQAADVRVSALLDADHLQAFHLPDSHIVELVRAAATVSARGHSVAAALKLERLTAGVARLVGLSGGAHGGVAPDVLAVRRTGVRTALAAFRERAHADRCLEVLSAKAAPRVAAAAGAGAATALLAASPARPLSYLTARPLEEASPQSHRLLVQWRGADFRVPGVAPTVARRLIHGSLGLQLPLSHLTQERDAERDADRQRRRTGSARVANR